jgi:hypothetical protein
VKGQKAIDPDTCISLTTLGIKLKSMLKNKIILQEEKEPLIMEVDQMYEMELDPQFYLSSLSEYLSEIRIHNLLKDSRKSKKSNTTLAREMVDVLKDNSSASDNGLVISPLIDCQMGSEPVEVVPTMISVIDSNMYGGLGLGELGILCGMTGLGKTTLAVNFCWGAAKLGFETALATLELPQKKISERLYSRISGLPYRSIRLGEGGSMDGITRDAWAKVCEEDMETRERFKIWDFSNGPCTISMLETRLKEADRQGIKPKMLFIDWLDALNTDPSERRNGVIIKELRHQLQAYSQGVADLAKHYNVAIWATTQSNSGGDNQKEIRMKNASEGFSKAWRCSCFLGLGGTDADRLENRITVTASKMRDGMIFKAEIQANLDIQTFCDLPTTIDDELANFTPIVRA